jgi:hypothetical protein
VSIEPEPEPLVLTAISDAERERFYEELHREIDKLERIPAHGYGNAGAWQYFREKSKQEYERTHLWHKGPCLGSKTDLDARLSEYEHSQRHPSARNNGNQRVEWRSQVSDLFRIV